MSEKSRRQRSVLAKVTQAGNVRTVTVRQADFKAGVVKIEVDADKAEIAIHVDGVRVSSTPIGEWVRRTRALESEVGASASADRMPETSRTRITVRAAADFESFETANLATDSLIALVKERIATPISDALTTLFRPKPGQIIVPR